jgi:hypothetical protein
VSAIFDLEFPTVETVANIITSPTISSPTDILFFSVGRENLHIGWLESGGTLASRTYEIQYGLSLSLPMVASTAYAAPPVTALNTSPPTNLPARVRFTSAAFEINGLIWCLSACINTKTGDVTYIDTQLLIPAAYLKVSQDGKRATYYHLYLKEADVVPSSFLINIGLGLGLPARRWALTYAPGINYWDATYINGSTKVYALGRDGLGAPLIRDITPAAEARRLIEPTRYRHYALFDPTDANVLTFSKPAGVK